MFRLIICMSVIIVAFTIQLLTVVKENAERRGGPSSTEQVLLYESKTLLRYESFQSAGRWQIDYNAQ